MSFLWLLEGIRTPFLDKLMQFITYFGQEVIIIAFVCALYWCIDQTVLLICLVSLTLPLVFVSRP